MSQTSHLTQSYRATSDKEPLKNKYSTRDSQNDPYLEDTEKVGRGLQKIGFKFDCTNFAVFFKHRTTNSRGSNDSHTGRMHLKKRSNETSSSSRENTLKRLSSKDLSNLEELYENTTIITTPQETKPHSKKVSNEIPMPWREYLLDAPKIDQKKKLRGMSLSGTSLTSKDERQEQQIIGTISKLGLSGDSEDQKTDISVGKDLKLSKSNFNSEVIERIKSKALHYRNSSLSAQKNSNDYFSSTLKQNVQADTFSEAKKAVKGSDQSKNEGFDFELMEAFKNSDSLLFRPFESGLSVLTSHFGSSRRQKEFESPEETIETDIPIKSIGTHFKPSKDLDNFSRKEPNLSTIPTESDGDNLIPNLNHHNNSYSTLLSGTNNSFNNSGKLDVNSPLRMDPDKPNDGFPSKTPKGSIQQKKGAYEGSGNNTDRSNSLSQNEENVILQEAQKSPYTNPNSHMSPSFNKNSYVSKNNNGIYQPAGQNLNKNAFSDNSYKSNKSKSKRPDQDSREPQVFTVDPKKIEMDPRTTLMIKNIPNKYDLNLLLETIERNHKGRYDFLYLPIDPRNRCNVGYAFINFLETRFIKDFYHEFNGRKWEKFNSEKICDLKYGRIQGKKALVHHFQYSNVMNQQDQKLKPHIPSDFDPLNNKKIKDLVNRQKLQNTGDNF